MTLLPIPARSRPRTPSLANALAFVLPMLAVAAAPNHSEAAGKYGFEVRVVLSEQAAKKLGSVGESITVSSFYHGDAARKPTKAEIKAAEQDGEQPGVIEIPGDEVTIAAAEGVADMKGGSIKRKQAVLFGDNPINVNVNVFSARKKSDDNLLDCGIFDGPLTDAQAKPVELSCKLIGEP